MRLIWKIKTKPIKFCNLFSSAPRPIDGQPHQDQLNMVIQSLLYQAEEFQNYLDLSKKQRKSQRPDFLNEHHAFLDDITKKLRSMNVPSSMSSSTLTFLPQSSTPYRSNYNRKPLTFSIGSQIANSSQFCWKKIWTKLLQICKFSIILITVYGAESTADKSYFDDNRSDWTLADISTLLQSKTRSLNVEKLTDSRKIVSVNKINAFWGGKYSWFIICCHF